MKSFLSSTYQTAAISLAYLFLLTISGCVVVELGLERTPQPLFNLTATVSALSTQNTELARLLLEATRQAEFTPELTGPTPSRTPGPSPTFTPTPLPPSFSDLRFSTQPEAANPRRFFVAGLPRLYAVWNYQNMQEGMLINRVWRYQGEEWLVREELWNYASFGSDGIMQGISIFENEQGLQAGEYSLSLYIDGVSQDLDPTPGLQDTITFWLFEPEVTEPVPSPDRARAAIVENGSILTIEEPTGEVITLAIAQEISSVSWFPDSRTILYTERDRSGQITPDDDGGITHRLWVIDVLNRERGLLSGAGENFHSPLIAPSGRFISVLVGPTFINYDECVASPELVIFELDPEYKRNRVLSLPEFEGLPDPGGAYPNPDARPLRWDTENRLTLSLQWPCPLQNLPPEGVFRINLGTMQIGRLE